MNKCRHFSSRTVVATGICLAMLLAAGLAVAANRKPYEGSVYSAFSVLSKTPPTRHACGPYVVRRATYKGTATSPDPRLAGAATLAARFTVVPATGQAVVGGTLKVRDTRGRLRLSATLSGLLSSHNVVSGILRGRLYHRDALLLANVTLVFNENLTFAAVRLGLEGSENLAIAYNQPRCH